MRLKAGTNKMKSSTKIGLVTHRSSKESDTNSSLSQLLNKTNESNFQYFRAPIIKKLDHLIAVVEIKNQQEYKQSIIQIMNSLFQKRDLIPLRSFFNIIKKIDKLFKQGNFYNYLCEEWLNFLFSLLAQKCEMEILGKIAERSDHFELYSFVIVVSSILMETLNKMMKQGKEYCLICQKVFQYSYIIFEITQSNISVNNRDEYIKNVLFFLRTFFAYSYLNVPQIKQNLSFFQNILELCLLCINKKVLSFQGVELLEMIERVGFREQSAENIYHLCWDQTFSLNSAQFEHLTFIMCKYHQSYTQSQHELDKCVSRWLSTFWQNCKQISMIPGENKDKVVETLQIYITPQILKSIFRTLSKEKQSYRSNKFYFQEILEFLLQETLKQSLVTCFALSLKLVEFIRMIVGKVSLYQQDTGKLVFGEEKSWLLTVIEEEVINRVYFGNLLLKQKENMIRKLFFIKIFSQLIEEMKQFCKLQKLLKITSVSLSWLIGQTLKLGSEQLIPEIKYSFFKLAIQYFAHAQVEEAIFDMRLQEQRQNGSDEGQFKMVEVRIQLLAKRIFRFQRRRLQKFCQTCVSFQLFLFICHNIKNGLSFKNYIFTSCFMLLFNNCTQSSGVEIGKIEETIGHLIKLSNIVQNGIHFKQSMGSLEDKIIGTSPSSSDSGRYTQLAITCLVGNLCEEVGKCWIQEENSVQQRSYFQAAELLIEQLQSFTYKKQAALNKAIDFHQGSREQGTEQFFKQSLREIENQINQLIIVIFSHYILNKMVFSFRSITSKGKKANNYLFLMSEVYLKLRQLLSKEQNLRIDRQKQRESGQKNENIIVGNLYELIKMPFIQKLTTFFFQVQPSNQNCFSYSSIASLYLSSQSLKSVTKFSLLSSILPLRNLYQAIEGAIAECSNSQNILATSRTSSLPQNSGQLELITLKGKIRIIRKVKIQQMIDQ